MKNVLIKDKSPINIKSLLFKTFVNDLFALSIWDKHKYKKFIKLNEISMDK